MRTHFTFHDVDVAVLERRLARLGLHLPIALKGAVTARLSVSVPLRSVFHAGAYELTGDLSSPQLTVEGVDLQKLSAHLHWLDGVLNLDALHFALDADGEQPVAGQKPATFAGTAQMQVEPRGLLTISASLEGLTAAILTKRFPQLSILRQGQFSGKVEASVPADDLRTISAWKAHGQANASDVHVAVVNVAGGNVIEVGGLRTQIDFDLRQSTVHATRFQLDSPLGHVQGTATAGLRSPLPFQLHATATISDLGALGHQAAVAIPLAGQGTATFDAQGSGEAMNVAVRSNITLSKVSVAGVSIPQASAQVAADEKTVTVSALRMQVAGGDVTGSVTLPIRAGQVAGSFAARNVRLEPISSAVKLAHPFGGAVSGDARFAFSRDHWRDVSQWDVEARASGDGLRLASSQSSRASVVLRLKQGTLDVSPLQADLDGGSVSGDVRLALNGAYAFQTTFSLVNLDVSRLARLLPLSPPGIAFAGRFSSRAQMRGTLEPLTAIGPGTFVGAGLGVNGVAVDRAAFRFALAESHVDFTDVDATAFGGRLGGNARLAWKDAESNAALSWTNIDVAPAARLVHALPHGLSVVSTGWVKARGPAGSVDPQAWTGQAAASAVASRNGRSLVTANASLGLDRGTLTLTNAHLDSGEARARLHGDVALASPFAFHVEGDATNVNLSIAKSLAGPALPFDVAGQLQAQLAADGTLQPLKLTGRASTKGRSLEIDKFLVDSWDAQVTSDGNVLRIERAAIDAYDGHASASATLPLAALAAKRGDAITAALQWQQIDLAKLPYVSSRLAAGLHAETDGKIDLSVPVDRLQQPEAWTSHASLKAQIAQGNGRTLGDLDGEARFVDGRLHAEGRGTLLGARVEIAADAQTASTPQGFTVDDVHLLVDHLQLNQLGDVSSYASLRHLRGALTATAELHPERT
ncbi:MAG TPA: hypothetical protein VHV77_06400, partial [Pirellulales bacterium]|nr:hypothetical protein [Pirellulales bacterium]